jgi:beta-glucosidase/6-phospho-beta-glucosidase/beta-galactosidase
MAFLHKVAQNLSTLSNPDLPELLFGVATSDHQAEAYDPICPDFRDEWEKLTGQTLRGRATDFWNRFRDDIALAKGLGCRIFRFSVAWSRVEPAVGRFDSDVLEHYREIASAIRENEMLPLVTLHHFTWPVHVQERGGMTADAFPNWFRLYAEQVVAAFGDLVPYWITFNEPNLLVYGYVKPWWQNDYIVPPGMPSGSTLSEQFDRATQLIKNIFKSHRLGRIAIHERYPQAKVGVNPFVLGVPTLLQRLMDFVASSTRSSKDFHRRARPMAEVPTLTGTPVDLVIASFAPTHDRARDVAFSTTYGQGAEKVVIRKGDPISSANDLNGRRVGYVRGSIAHRTIARVAPAALPRDFATHHQGLEALQSKWIDAFVAEDARLAQLQIPAGLMILPEALTELHYAVAVSRGNPELLSLVNAVIRGYKCAPSDLHGPLLQEIRRRGYLRVGVNADPAQAKSNSSFRKEIDIAESVAEQIFERPGRVQFEPLRLDERTRVLQTPLRLFEPVLKAASVVGTILNSNWWHLGMAGKLPEFLCPENCVGQQDFVGLDYYWGIESVELHRLHQLVDATMSRFESAPVNPEGLGTVLRRLNRWFPGQEILIIENGCIDAADTYARAEYLQAHIREVTRARAAGIPVRGYICWSITSNREWGLPFNRDSDFGLYHIDLDHDPDLVRTETPSAKLYQRIISEERQSAGPA